MISGQHFCHLVKLIHCMSIDRKHSFFVYFSIDFQLVNPKRKKKIVCNFLFGNILSIIMVSIILTMEHNDRFPRNKIINHFESISKTRFQTLLLCVCVFFNKRNKYNWILAFLSLWSFNIFHMKQHQQMMALLYMPWVYGLAFSVCLFGWIYRK